MSEYRPNSLLAETVQSGDAYSVRAALVAIILSEPSFSNGTIYKAIEYAEKNGISVFESNDPDVELKTDSSAWNESYFAKVSNQLGENFSRERLAHLEKIGKKVYGSVRETAASDARQTRTQQPSVSRPREYSTENKTVRENENFLKSHQAAVAAIAAIAVVAAVIIIIKKIL